MYQQELGHNGVAASTLPRVQRPGGAVAFAREVKEYEFRHLTRAALHCQQKTWRRTTLCIIEKA